MPNYNDEPRPSTPSSSKSGLSIIKTLNTADRFKRIENRLNKVLEDLSDVGYLVSKLSKGARATWYELEQLRFEYNYQGSARLARWGRQDTSRLSVRSKAILTSNQLIRMKRIAFEGDNLAALDKLRPKWKKVMAELKRHCRRTGRRIK